MSWICGLIGDFDDNLVNDICQNFHAPIYQMKNEKIFIIAGGRRETCLNYESNDLSQNIILGIGIKPVCDSYKIADVHDWKNASDKEIIDTWNGHFIKICIANEKINFITDQIGLRDLFFYKVSDKTFIFSTNQGKLAKICNLALDYEKISTKWLLFDQISNESIFQNIIRINQGSELIFNRSNFFYSIKQNNWLPNITENFINDEIFENELTKILACNFETNYELFLSLSGGFDSRILLSCFNNIKTFSFGEKNVPDVKIAYQICNSLGLENQRISLELPEPDKFFKEMIDCSSQICFSKPISEFLNLRNYNYFLDKNIVNIDGAFGEIWRRVLSTKLFVFGKKDLLSRNYDNILKYLTYHKANIFNDDINELMKFASQKQIANFFNLLPEIEDIGVENFIDLFVTKTKFASSTSFEQARLDEILINFMPFAQKSLLDLLFQVKIQSRKNAKMLKKVIQKRNPKLSKFPLVKGDDTYPYYMNSLQIKIQKKIKQKLGLNKKNTTLENFSKITIDMFREYLLDLLNSKRVKENAAYSYKKLDDLSEKLHKNALSTQDYKELDWWFSLESITL